MDIVKIEICNYRSIKRLSYAPGSYSVVIGENNAGKSNVLRAVNLVLGESWPSERSFSEDDFHNRDTANPISIKVFFNEIIEEWRNGFKASINGFELVCRAYKRQYRAKPAGTLVVDYHCIGADGQVIKIPDSPLQKGQQFKGQWLPMRVSNDLRDKVPFIYVDVTRDYDRHSPGGRWSILRRLFDEVNKEFTADKSTISINRADGTVVKMTRREAFENSVKEAYQYLRTRRFEEIEQRLAANALEHMGLDPREGEVLLHFQAHDPSNAYKSLQLFVRQLEIETTASEVGSGLQSAVVVSIFRTYEELKKEGAIFAIEEPEVFLHPQKARFFQGVLRGLAEKGNQVFVTTHSPVFVDLARPECVALVSRRSSEGSTIKQAVKIDLVPTERDELRLLSEFDAQRSELFFARKIVFVEGACEKLVLPMVFAAMGIDINRQGISVIECGGKTKLKLFARVANALDIPYVVIVDHDVREIQNGWSEQRKAQQRQRNADHTRWNTEIEAVVPREKLFYLIPDLESVSGLPTSGDADKLDRAVNYYKKISSNSIPKEVLAAIDVVMNSL